MEILFPQINGQRYSISDRRQPFWNTFSSLKDAYLLDFIPHVQPFTKETSTPPKSECNRYGALQWKLHINQQQYGQAPRKPRFLHLRRKYKHIFYYKDRGECDFIVIEKNTVIEAIQVCLTITNENFDREYNGLKQGTIVTLNQSDRFEKEGIIIKMISAISLFHT